MVSLAHAPLTRIGFRRDVRLFLICLVGFLVVLIFSLLLLLRTDLTRTEDSIDWSRMVIADIASDAINHTRAEPSTLQTQLVFLRGRFNIASIELDLRSGQKIFSGGGDVGARHRRFISGACQFERTRFGIGEDSLTVHGDTVGVGEKS